MKWLSAIVLLCAGPALAQPAPAALDETARAGELQSAATAGRAPSPANPNRALTSSETAPLEGAIDPKRYVVGPGDQLLLELWGLRDESRQVVVNPEGRLFIPSVGVLPASGETLDELRQAVEQKVHAVYPRLHGSITLAEPRTFLVNVTGAVAHPGTYSATALSRVSAILPEAGGALPSGSLRQVEIRRKGAAKPLIADLVRFRMLGESEGDPTVLDGDTLFVPARQCTVEISGAVRRPGRYELTGNHQLGELVALAGGPSAEAARGQPWRVTTRATGNGRDVRSIAPNAATVELHDGDRVHVPSLGDLRQVVVVEGAIVGPPRASTATAAADPPGDPADDPSGAPLGPTHEVSVPVPFVAGDGVRDLVVKVNGLQPWADGQSAYLLRPSEKGRRQRIAVDVPAIVSGRAADIELRAGDALVIPSRRESVLVSGAVQRPGLYQYNPELHPIDYVHLAGGVTRNGATGDARVLSPSGGTQKLSSVGAIEPGDTITVPERRFTAADWTTISLVLGNLAVGVAAVTLTATR
ncbi:MAG TPA: SLBB domain-containing protein [Polyangia bacterium]